MHLLILLTSLFTGSLGEHVIGAALGGSASFRFNVSGDPAVTLTEVSRCPAEKVMVFSPDHGLHIDDSRYQGRLSVSADHSLRLEKIRESDFGTYCYKLSTFPAGSVTGEMTLVREEHGGFDTVTISLICGGSLCAALIGIIVGVICSKMRRNNSTHTVSPSGGLQVSQSGKASQSPSNKGEVERDIEYVNM